ncbi:hypothetical protein M758_5G198100 [Ceratodon purpureus]|uniref:Uncharacterized protein n=1 Tax=Ceratodon purpureus TaxID=3225 RepID=A0A8T0I527_CERPU|nr:hypothetical protein KC19_5G204400 [Ceratodon purpureus]KAG0617553.1 hypothetical protein M758_5G198100 [Ceratodon purpureus]
MYQHLPSRTKGLCYGTIISASVGISGSLGEEVALLFRPGRGSRTYMIRSSRPLTWGSRNMWGAQLGFPLKTDRHILLCASLDRDYHRPLKGKEPYVEPHLLERRADEDAKGCYFSSLHSQAVHGSDTSGFFLMC